MNKDSWIVSAIYGRVGAAIWTILGVALGLTSEQTTSGNEAVIAVLGGVGALLALVSKLREIKK